MDVHAPISVVAASYADREQAAEDFASVWASRHAGDFHHTAVALLHGGAARLGGIGQEGRERRFGHVAGEHAAILLVPALRRGRSRQLAGAERNGVRLGRNRDRRHAIILRLRGGHEPPGRCQQRRG